MNKYAWLEKRTLRTVDQLRLWPDNPRLDPDEKHVSVIDYVSDLIADNGEKDSFLRLVSSIASHGYIPADPIIVWKNDANDRYYVAEGNRRTLALKLLRNPNKAPRSIRSYIRSKAEVVDRSDLEKIRVCVAPSFEDCEWYINQRHANSTIQRSWSRLQQQRWIAKLYDKYDKNVDKVVEISRMNKGQLEYTLRILKIRDFSLNPSIFSKLDREEQESVKSHRVPMTIFERWFTNQVVKEKWGFDFDGDNIIITSDRRSFLFAYTAWLKLVIHRDEPDSVVQINTRTITSNLDGILQALPKVSFGNDNEDQNEDNDATTGSSGNDSKGAEEDNSAEIQGQNGTSKPKTPLSKNPDRNQIVIPTCQLKTTNFKLDALFNEFKALPISRYKNCAAAALRVFVDLAISEYIVAEDCKDDMKDHYKKAFQDITLKQRLEYLKQHKIASRTPASKVVEKLLNHTNDYSLDTLNNYIHGSHTHHTGKRFLNGFWDFLYPLFETIMDIKEL